MRSFIERLLGRPEPAPERADEPPAWAQELADQLQKGVRAQARVGLRVDEVERKLEAGFADLRDGMQGLAASGARPEELDWDPLLDALDLLDQAARSARSRSVELADGLDGVRLRIEQFLRQTGISRVSPDGRPPDGRCFRVVGTLARPDLAEGTVARTIRAAVLQGERLLREGEVLVSAGAETPDEVVPAG